LANEAEAVVALAVLAVAAAIVAGAMMVIEGAKAAMARAEREDRPDIIQVKSRFNRAVFETPRSGKLPPLTLPVYEPLIDPIKLSPAGGTVVARQSLLRNVVSGTTFLNLYIFGIEPEKESQVTAFSVGHGRFLRTNDGAVAVLDQASADALGADLVDSFPVRKADGQDLSLTVVGILDRLELRDPPPLTVAAPALDPDSNYVSSGLFVTLRTSEEIFGRSTLTDALVTAPAPEDVPSLVDELRGAFRLEPGVFITDATISFAARCMILLRPSLCSRSLAQLQQHWRNCSLPTSCMISIPIDGASTRCCSRSASHRCKPQSSELPSGSRQWALGRFIGAVVAVTCSPSHFAMPSLMADLGAIEPSFDLLIAAVVIGIALAAVALGMAPTAWWLHKRSVASTLSEQRR
jgi:hypothetical protein